METEVQELPHLDVSNSPHVIMRFPITGRELPADHGYALYAAVSRLAPALHDASWLGIELINGVPWREGVIMLPTRGASFSLRLPAERCAQALRLAGKRIDIANNSIRLGIPTIKLLEPARNLYARIVVIKKFMEPEPFLEAAYRQLATLSISGKLEVPLDEEGRFRRRVITVCGRTIVGFSLLVRDLSDDDSLLLQARGLGGKRHMGCGIFNPIRGLQWQSEE